ncbi:MAG: hypothetical protein ACJA2P_000621 [Rhodoferax sp.]|jgi:hypothetical protein
MTPWIATLPVLFGITKIVQQLQRRLTSCSFGSSRYQFFKTANDFNWAGPYYLFFKEI